MKRARLIIAELDARGLLAGATEIANAHRLSVEDAFLGNHWPAEVAARHAIWAWMHELFSPSGARLYGYAAMGRLFGVDHTTVIAAVRKMRLRRAVARSDALAEERGIA